MTSIKSSEQIISELFEATIALPIDQQADFVQRQNQDPAIVREVIELLNLQNTQGEEFLVDRPLGIVEHQDHTTEISEKTGDVIGRYKLLHRIGEGGMGVVYMAQQIEGVDRRVALKVIKLGMDSRQVVARFETERQAMALFNHPGITRLLDTGTTETGRPYYVMELVKGQAITDFAKKQDLMLNERLALFCDACLAIQHAHQKGIIHRDIKPSNILVGFVDGKPIPKVIDFGIAKALHHRLTEKTVVTRHSAFIGTPQYMSPEQAESSGVDVDTRSDVYSLGILLYELLTGSTPLCKDELSQLNPLALIETLRNHEVETPSTRVSRLNASGQTSPRHLQTGDGNQLPQELDWIVMKSLEHNRNRRYQSASDFAGDIQRFMTGEAVNAAPPSKYYRLQKILRKHSKAISIAAVCALVVLISAISSFLFGWQAHIARTEQANAFAVIKEQKADLENTLHELRNAQLLNEAQNKEIRLRKVLDAAYYRFNGQKAAEFANLIWSTKSSFDANAMLEKQLRFAHIFDSLPQKDVLNRETKELVRISKSLIELRMNSNTASPIDTVMQSMFEVFAKQPGAPKGNLFVQSESSLEIDGIPMNNQIPENLIPAEMGQIDLFEIEPRPEVATQYLRILSQEFEIEFRDESGDLGPENAIALKLLGAALIQEGKTKEALATLRLALNLSPSPQSKETARQLIKKCNGE